MKISDQQQRNLLALLAEGKTVLLGEFIGAKPETINYTDKKSGKAASFDRIVLVVVTGGSNGVDAVKATYSVKPGESSEKVMAALKLPSRGGQVALDVESIELDRGNKTIRVSGVTSLGA